MRIKRVNMEDILGLSPGVFIALCCLVGYCVISGALLRWGGWIWHSKKTSDQLFNTRLIAHRGHKADNIAENTLHGFRVAEEEGVDMVEVRFITVHGQ